MNIFFTSDNHYFHDNIIKYCNRPFQNSDEMNSSMLLKWNSCVASDDIGIFVGDISAGLKGKTLELQKIIQNLNGRKILIRGNHDHQSSDWYIDSGFIQVFDYLDLKDILITHYPFQLFIEKNKSFENKKNDFYVVHGHIHAPGPNIENHFNVAADRNDFHPWSYHDVIPPELRDQFRENIEKLLINTPNKNLIF